MKVFIVAIIAALCIVAHAKLTEEQRQEILTKSIECKQSTKVDVTIVEEAKKGDYARAKENKEFGEYAVCLAKSLHFLNDAGEVQKDVVLKYLAKEKSDDVDKCAAITDETPLKTHARRAVCIQRQFVKKE